MADAKITQLVNYPTPIPADVVPIVDTALLITKKITLDNIANWLLGLGTKVGKFLMMRQTTTWHCAAGFQAQTQSVSITQNVWAWITNGGNNLWTAIENSAVTMAGDVFTFTNAGDYLGVLSLTFSGTNNDEYQIRAYNVTQAIQLGYYQGSVASGATIFANVSLPLYLSGIHASDVIRFEIKNLTHSNAATVRNLMLNLTYLHD